MLLKNKVEIEEWLKKYNIRNYELIENEKYGYIINVNTTVYLWKKELKSIDVKFNQVNGDFNCAVNKLKSLIGCPEIVTGYFNCAVNELKSLKHIPKKIGGSFFCSANKLKSLDGSPRIVNGLFVCGENQLESLIGGPEIVNGIFDCSDNRLTSLEGFPKKILRDIILSKNKFKLKELKVLNNIKGKHFINLNENENLGELQSVCDLREIKTILGIYKEKENIDKSIDKLNLLINNKDCKIINKVKKI